MKEATGELNMTVITVVALAAVGALLYAFVWPLIKARIVEQTCQMMGADYHAVAANSGSCGSCMAADSSKDEADKVKQSWCCCGPNQSVGGN